MHFREATPTDADAIALLHAENWRRAYRGAYSDDYLDGPVYDDRRNVWRDRYDTPRDDMYTALAEDDDGTLVGFACSFAPGVPENDDQGWGVLLDNLHVAAAAEGGSIGRRLVAASALWAERTYPDAGFYLWVLEDNARARPFYEHIGATNEGLHLMPSPGGEVRSLRYVWHSIDPLRPYAPEVQPAP
jgi:ribosomal protein S18 acetylase RimI-like enzyme